MSAWLKIHTFQWLQLLLNRITREVEEEEMERDKEEEKEEKEEGEEEEKKWLIKERDK